MKINKFGKFIKERRLDKNLGLREFGRMATVSPSYLSRMEAGDFPPPSEEKIIKMAEVLGGDADFFLSMGDKIHPDTQLAIISSMGLWSHFIRNNENLLWDFLEKAKQKIKEENDDNL